MVVEEQNPCQLPGGFEICPIDCGSTGAVQENEGLKGWVEGSQESEIGRVFRILVSGMYRRSLHSPPFPATHLCSGISDDTQEGKFQIFGRFPPNTWKFEAVLLEECQKPEVQQNYCGKIILKPKPKHKKKIAHFYFWVWIGPCVLLFWVQNLFPAIKNSFPN